MDFCQEGTKEKCLLRRKETGKPVCNAIHFKKIVMPHTDENLGNCSYLDTCRHMEYCKYIHYKIDEQDEKDNLKNLHSHDMKIKPKQWINCDLRTFDFTVLGECECIMLDPPWDIHMTLPYGTLKDKEMKSLRVDLLQKKGLIFLWVTGRAMELGRECLKIWGYQQIEEIVWIKTNQLQRIIRTGRTGHWLNHSKEHCLVGIKGHPVVNRNVDCDVIVSKVRETSRKPDEIYGMIERMFPGGRKVELFARPHNRMPGWISLGNQLKGTYIEDPDILEKYRKTYKNPPLTDEDLKRAKDADDEEHNKKVYGNHIQKPPSLLLKNNL